MPCLLPADCLNEVFENLDDDKITLHSCLLVSRLWCKVSIEILWRDIWSFKYSVAYDRQLKVVSSILNVLISCLPNESKELLHKNQVLISTPFSKPLLFNYASFCKVLSINEIGLLINKVLNSKDPYIIPWQRLFDRNCLVAKEILKMFMDQVSSLKTLTFLSTDNIIPYNKLPFTSFPGARNCLTNLSELYCSTGIRSEFFNGLSQICHSLRSLAIDFESEVSNELKELVSLQNNLKNLKLSAYNGIDWTDIIPDLTNHSNTLTKLQLYGDDDNGTDGLPVSFVSSFLNLQEIEFSFTDETEFEGFKELQYVAFPKLQILKIPYQGPEPEYLMKFLETNGENLEEFHTYEKNEALNSSIARFCPNLKKFSETFENDEL